MEIILAEDEIPENLKQYFEPVPDTLPMSSIFRFPTQGFSLQMCQRCKTIYEPEAYRNLAEISVGKRSSQSLKISQLDTPGSPMYRDGHHQDGLPAKRGRYLDPELNIRHGLGRSTLDKPLVERHHSSGPQMKLTGLGRGRPLVAPHHPYRGDGWEEQAIEGREQERKVKICPKCGSTEWLSHFAVFPEELVRRCLLATCPPYVCPKCGRPWVRVLGNPQRISSGGYGSKTANEVGLSPSSGIRTKEWREYESLGWEPSCKCGLPQDQRQPGTALDPFLGSGTTSVVAKSLGRRSIGVDISEDYLRLSQYRVEQTNFPLFPITEEVIQGINKGAATDG